MKTWIKLYTEILSDPKMGRLNDKTFRRTIELFLLAGKEDNSGELPSVEDMAWTLHITEKEVQSVLVDLEKIGIVKRHTAFDGSEKYLISKFTERQNSDKTKSEINREYYLKSKQGRSEIQNNSDLIQTESKSEIQTELRKGSGENKTLEVEEEVEVDIEEDKEIKEKATAKSEKPQKHKHGQFANVLLTDEELTKLHERFTDADARIETFSVAKQAKGYKYSSDYAAILKWAQNDQKRYDQKPLQGQVKRTYSAAEILAMSAGGQI